MNSVLVYLMLIALVIRPNGAALVYVVMTVGFTVMWSDLDPHDYFITAVLTDLGCMMLLTAFNMTRRVLGLMVICFLSILLNLFGFIMWYMYQSPDWYVWMFAAVYAGAICIILKKDVCYVGGRNTGLYFYRINHHSSVDTSRRNFIKGDTTT